MNPHISIPVPPELYSDVNMVLTELHAGVQSVLGEELIGMYLDGSMASGDFDRDSDIDFVVVTYEEISDEQFSALRSLHERIATLDSPFAIELEGTYISQAALRRFDPALAWHPNIQRGKPEQLEWERYDDDWWLVHLVILRERGLTLLGPAPQTLVDPVSSNALKRAMLKRLNGWAAGILENPTLIHTRGYQSYVVLSLCRILYTLEFGTIASKPVAARWAREALDARWRPLIDRTWESRHNPALNASAEDVNETLEFIRFTLERSKQYEMPTDET